MSYVNGKIGFALIHFYDLTTDVGVQYTDAVKTSKSTSDVNAIFRNYKAN